MTRYLRSIVLASILLWSHTASAQVQPGPAIAENQGVRLGVYKTFNCSTNLTCALSNNVLSVTGAGGGVGDVVGPAGATDTAIARFNTATGKLIQNSKITIDNFGSMTDGGSSWDSPNGELRLGSATNHTTLALFNYSLSDPNTNPLVLMNGLTWNTTAAPTLIKADLTDTASAAASLFLDLQISTVPKFSIRKDGAITVGSWNATAIGNTKGGTGVDSSGFTGLAYVTAGVWSQGINLASISGNTTKAATVSGAQTSGKCLEWDANGNVATGVSNAACGSGGSGYATIQDEGTSLTQRATANFIGSGITCTDNAGNTRTDCTVNLGTLLDQQTFTTGSGNWTKVSGAAMVLVRACGQGGGGGAGSAAGQSAIAAGGGGGGGGSCVERWFLASDLGSTEAYVVGTGANHGVGAAGAVGGDGTAGNNTTFGTTKLIGFGGGGGAGNILGAAGGGGAGLGTIGANATTTTAVVGGDCAIIGVTSVGNADCRGAGSIVVGGLGVLGQPSFAGGASGSGSATDGSAQANQILGGVSYLSGGGGAAGGGVTTGNATENGGVGGDTGWTIAAVQGTQKAGGGGAAGLTASACGSGGEGKVGATGSTIKAGQGAGGGASKQGTGATGCVGGNGGQPAGGGGGGGGANLGAAGTGSATGGNGGDGGAGQLWVWTYGSAAGPNSYTNTSAYSAINNTTTKTYFGIAADGKLPAGVINTAGKRLEIKLSGVYGALISDTIVISVEICQVSGCASGTVVALAATAALTPTAETNNGWMATVNCNVFTVGAAGTLDCQGMTFMGQAAGTGLVSQMQNTAALTVNTTVDEYVSAAVTWAGVGAPSATDTITLRNFGAQIY